MSQAALRYLCSASGHEEDEEVRQELLEKVPRGAHGPLLAALAVELNDAASCSTSGANSSDGRGSKPEVHMRAGPEVAAAAEGTAGTAGTGLAGGADAGVPPPTLTSALGLASGTTGLMRVVSSAFHSLAAAAPAAISGIPAVTGATGKARSSTAAGPTSPGKGPGSSGTLLVLPLALGRAGHGHGGRKPSLLQLLRMLAAMRAQVGMGC